jgi:uroporphyrinogen-III decarboxylase
LMENEALYQERLTRIKRAINFEPVDRVPVVFVGTAFAARYMGMKLADYVNDPEAPHTTLLEAMDKIGGFDGLNSAMVSGKMTVGTGLVKMNMPGRELPEDSVWQVVESEVMTAEDYDRVLEIGWQAFCDETISRLVEDMPAYLENMAWVRENSTRIYDEYRKRGYPIVSGPGGGMVPLELIAGVRSLPQLVFDFHRRPDKVQAVMDLMMPDVLAGAVAMAEGSPALGAWCGGWRGAPSFLAPKLFDRFFWPYFVQLVDKMISIGQLPVLHLDQKWDRELDKLAELPDKKCLLNPDGMTDLRRFREVVGDRMAVMGDVPASMMSLGTPDEVFKYVQDLIRDVGPRGLIVTAGCDAPVNTKPENMEAMVAAVYDYGSVA